jgi:hypothetical protein
MVFPSSSSPVAVWNAANRDRIDVAHILLLKPPAQQCILFGLEMVQFGSLASAAGGKDQLAEIGNSALALTNCSDDCPRAGERCRARRRKPPACRCAGAAGYGRHCLCQAVAHNRRICPVVRCPGQDFAATRLRDAAASSCGWPSHWRHERAMPAASNPRSARSSLRAPCSI